MPALIPLPPSAGTGEKSAPGPPKCPFRATLCSTCVEGWEYCWVRTHPGCSAPTRRGSACTQGARLPAPTGQGGSTPAQSGSTPEPWRPRSRYVLGSRCGRGARRASYSSQKPSLPSTNKDEHHALLCLQNGLCSPAERGAPRGRPTRHLRVPGRGRRLRCTCRTDVAAHTGNTAALSARSPAGGGASSLRRFLPAPPATRCSSGRAALRAATYPA